jgi:phenylacetic acid degradation operon negative regulatory protein
MALTQNLILRIVAQRGGIGSSELVGVAQKFGLSSDAVRAAANRMARTGLLVKRGRGRGNVHYELGPAGQTVVERFIRKFFQWHMSLEGEPPWDGTWTVVAFSVPEDLRGKRGALRQRLAEMGFGLLSPSVWISPVAQEAEVAAQVAELGLGGMVAILHCDRIQMPGLAGVTELAHSVWDLEPVARHYSDMNRRIEALMASLGRASQGEQVDAEALFFEAMDLQTEILDVILSEDPCLPPDLLPADWPGHQTHELAHLFTAAIDGLGQVSECYEYLFYLIKGMEVLEVFRYDGDIAFRWPEAEEAG